jgi:hypothetical protein
MVFIPPMISGFVSTFAASLASAVFADCTASDKPSSLATSSSEMVFASASSVSSTSSASLVG